MILERFQDNSNKNNTFWALSNLARGTPLPNYDKIKRIIETMCKVIADK